MLKEREKHHMWTKEEIKAIISLWNDKSVDDIAKELGLNRERISYMAHAIRMAGYKLPRKRILGTTKNLIQEVLSELN